MPNSMQLLADEVIERALFCCDAFGPKMALNVTCGNATIPSLSGDKRTHRDDRPSVVRDPLRKSSTYQARAATWPLSLALMKREASGRGQPAGGDGASP